MSLPFISMVSLLEVRRNNKLKVWQRLAFAHLRSPNISLGVFLADDERRHELFNLLTDAPHWP